MRHRSSRSGFSLVELVTTIALTGLLAVGFAQLLQHPIRGYAAVSRRAELVSIADASMRRMARDLRRALPNSIRIAAGGTAIELLHTQGGARYRLDPGVNDPGGPAEQDHRADDDRLGFGGDTRWNVLGRVRNVAFSHGVPLPAGVRIAIYPTNSSIWARAANGTNPSPITPATTRITIVDDGDEDQIQLSASHRFQHESPSARLFLVDTPITYLCDPADGSLWRIDGYSITSGQPTDPALAPLAGGRASRAADHVETCRFRYLPGTASRAALVTLEVVLAEDGERVQLLQQVQVDNAP